jgi:hypothetical protein
MVAMIQAFNGHRESLWQMNPAGVKFFSTDLLRI